MHFVSTRWKGSNGFRQSCVCNMDTKNRMNGAPTAPQEKGVRIFPRFGLTAGHCSSTDTGGVADRTWGVSRMPGFQFENWDRFLANRDEQVPLKQSGSSTPLAGPARASPPGADFSTASLSSLGPLQGAL